MFLITISFFVVFKFKGQNDTLQQKKNKPFYFGFPIIYYTPETRFAFGASGFTSFNFKNDTIGAPQSKISFIGIYTQNKQVLFYVPFNLFFKNRTYQINGEVGYYNFNYLFYGIGNSSNNNTERYFLKYPRVRIALLKKVYPKFFIGVKYLYDNISLYNLDTAGLLIKRDIVGSNGGVVSAGGLTSIYDSRDNIFFPSKGIYFESSIIIGDKKIGSDFNYVKATIDVSKFINFKNNIFAFNFYSTYTSGLVPFYQMGVLGGANRMRGFYEGRYRDNQLLLFQTEYRRILYKQIGIVLFANAGQVASQWQLFNLTNTHYTYGAGLRIVLDKKQKINLRTDAAIGNAKILPYFTLGEAF